MVKGNIPKYFINLFYMTNEYKQQLVDMGVDVSKALDRFMGSEALYDKFLLKFIQDSSYQKMIGFINAGDISQAFMQAHTMKGIAANLELGYLLEVLVPMTEQLRHGELDNIPEEQEDLEVRYNRLCTIIRKNH